MVCSCVSSPILSFKDISFGVGAGGVLWFEYAIEGLSSFFVGAGGAVLGFASDLEERGVFVGYTYYMIIQHIIRRRVYSKVVSVNILTLLQQEAEKFGFSL